jgi:hypothetical protein
MSTRCNEDRREDEVLEGKDLEELWLILHQALLLTHKIMNTKETEYGKAKDRLDR